MDAHYSSSCATSAFFCPRGLACFCLATGNHFVLVPLSLSLSPSPFLFLSLSLRGREETAPEESQQQRAQSGLGLRKAWQAQRVTRCRDGSLAARVCSRSLLHGSLCHLVAMVSLQLEDSELLKVPGRNRTVEPVHELGGRGELATLLHCCQRGKQVKSRGNADISEREERERERDGGAQGI